MDGGFQKNVLDSKGSNILNYIDADSKNDEVTIKVEQVDCEETDIEPCSTTSSDSGQAKDVHPLQTVSPIYPSMVSVSTRRFSDTNYAHDSEQRNEMQSSNERSPFERFRDQILGAIKVEFPNANEEEAYHIAARRWSMLSDEQKRSFGFKGSHSEKRGSNLLTGRLRGVHYDHTEESEEQESSSNDFNKDVAKFGRCTWCKNYGNLNDYSANLQGREIYCTGLCSKKCFEQAARKIINVEAGYGLENSVYPESVPIRTDINLDVLNSEPRIARDDQHGGHTRAHNDGARPRFDSTRVQQDVVRSNDMPRHHPIVLRPNSNPQVSNPELIRVSNWSSESSKSIPSGEPLRISKTDLPYGIAENIFEWNSYLKRNGSVAAPLSCFSLQRTSSSNTFKVGMKLEVNDPRQDSVVCIATVVAVLGPRLRLHLDGCSKSDDIWLLYDSGHIHPVGWCEGNGGALQKPQGFSYDAGDYKEFIQKTLSNAELAPMSSFKSEPAPPKENTFSTGMKLEAVDKNNPALIGVATVTEVDGDRVRIEFDGFKGVGYWTTYRDKDLFYAGWCYANGYPLQPPGTQVIRPEPINPYCESSNSRSSPSAREKRTQQLTPSHGEVDVRINGGCNPGPYLDTNKVASIPSAYKGCISVVLKTVLEDMIRCAYDPKTVFGFLKPGRGNIVVNAVADGVVYNCYLSNVDRVSTFWKVMEQFCDNLRCCSNMISGFELQTTCPQCGRASQLRNNSGVSLKRPCDVRSNPIKSNVSVCISSTPDSTAVSTADLVERISEIRESPKRKRPDSILSRFTTSPRSWSVDEVASLIERTDLKAFSSLFRDNDIDGKALLLLTRDIVINYMGLKIGPAVKLLDLIDELKELDNRFR